MVAADDGSTLQVFGAVTFQTGCVFASRRKACFFALQLTLVAVISGYSMIGIVLMEHFSCCWILVTVGEH